MIDKSIAKATIEFKKAMAQLEKSRDVLEDALSFQKALLEKAGVIIMATNEKGIITQFNKEAVTELGYDKEEIVRKETPLLFHTEEDLKTRKSSVLETTEIKTGDDFDILVNHARQNIHEEVQYNYLRKNGETFPVSLTITALRNKNKEITGYVFIAMDISERLRAEKKLQKAENLFFQLLHNYPDGVISIINRQNEFVYTGGALHRRLNADVGKLIGNSIYPFFPEPIRRIISLNLDKVFNEKVSITDFEFPFPVANGLYIMDAFPLTEDDGTVNHAGIIIKNISKLKEAEEKLREDLKLEKELNELKSRFLSMASHEFRTPLSTILSSTYLLEKYKTSEDQPKREKHLNRIISSVNVLTSILNDFLNLGKIEEGKLKPKFSEFNLEENIQSTIDEISATLRKNQKIQYEHGGNQMVTLDPNFLKNILINLISNACKFSPESATILVRSSQHNGVATLMVSDQGIGISKEDQQHLMERFFRATNAQNIEGTGLGLHIVSRYVEMLNGTIEFQSELGKGTEFKIKFKTPDPV